MSSKNINRIWWGLFVTLILLLGYHIDNTQRYGLFFREQQQLFLFDSDYISETLTNIGGLSTLISRYIVQFFYSPSSAVIITTIILAIITVLTKRIISEINDSWCVYPLSIIPALCLSISLLDNNYFYDNVISYLITMAALRIYLYARKKAYAIRLSIGVLLTIIVFITAASASVLFAACALLIDILKKDDKSYLSLTYVATSLVLGLIFLYFGGVGTYEQICTPTYFYEITARFKHIHYASWSILPICLLLSYGANYLNSKAKILFPLIITALVFVQYRSSYNDNTDKNEQRRYRYEYLTINERWDELKKLAYENMNNYTDANYMNLALSKKGELADVLFKFPQHGPYSLINVPKDKTQDIKLARVLFEIGDYAAAQNVAFNALNTSNGYNPSMLEIIANVEAERGERELALKYADLLFKSLRYKEKAKKIKDSITKKSSFSKENKDIFVLYSSPMEDIYNLLDNDSTNLKAFSYGISYLLLAKDFNNAYDFIDRYYARSGMNALPICAQEALLFFSDYYATMNEEYATKLGLTAEQLNKNKLIDTPYCQSHGVGKETTDRFLRFKEDYGRARNGNSAVALSPYKGTFWYYLLFENI